MKKTYKQFGKIYLGSSDYAALTLTGNDREKGVKAMLLKFGGDDAYDAYLVDDDDAEIGAHYDQVAAFDDWMTVYDDDGIAAKIKADKIAVYRAGNYGCIVKVTRPRL